MGIENDVFFIFHFPISIFNYFVMISNGTVQAGRKTGGGKNEFGEPVGAEVVWEKPLPCFIKAVERDEMGEIGGNNFRASAYSVLVNGVHFKASVVRLVCFGEALGEFRVRRMKRLGIVNKTVIMC